MTLEKLPAWAVAAGLPLSPDQITQFKIFEENLYEANQVMNLTRVPREECWTRHFADSLLFQDAFPLGASVLDIGTGPGFPAWPLACARPDLTVTALDSNRKMLGFLKSQPLANLTVVEGRAEEWPSRNQFDCVTGRAVAPLPAQLEISVAACKLGGRVMPMRTPSDDLNAPDLKTMGLQLEEIYARQLPDSDAGRILPVYKKVRATPANLPRRWAEIKTNPLHQ
jgi:16S rRNA (guanine527-N7)-methyltransferase